MTFSVLTYVLGGYAVICLVVVLAVDWERTPVRVAPRHPHDRPPLRPWPRTARRCPVARESALPLRSARVGAVPPRRRRPSATCRR
jgi:hypothetical protein